MSAWPKFARTKGQGRSSPAAAAAAAAAVTRPRHAGASFPSRRRSTRKCSSISSPAESDLSSAGGMATGKKSSGGPGAGVRNNDEFLAHAGVRKNDEFLAHTVVPDAGDAENALTTEITTACSTRTGSKALSGAAREASASEAASSSSLSRAEAQHRGRRTPAFEHYAEVPVQRFEMTFGGGREAVEDTAKAANAQAKHKLREETDRLIEVLNRNVNTEECDDEIVSPAVRRSRQRPDFLARADALRKKTAAKERENYAAMEARPVSRATTPRGKARERENEDLAGELNGVLPVSRNGKAQAEERQKRPKRSVGEIEKDKAGFIGDSNRIIGSEV